MLTLQLWTLGVFRILSKDAYEKIWQWCHTDILLNCPLFKLYTHDDCSSIIFACFSDEARHSWKFKMPLSFRTSLSIWLRKIFLNATVVSRHVVKLVIVIRPESQNKNKEKFLQILKKGNTVLNVNLQETSLLQWRHFPEDPVPFYFSLNSGDFDCWNSYHFWNIYRMSNNPTAATS